MVSTVGVAVAASGEHVDRGGVRVPRGDLHGWQRRRSETLCGMSLKRARLRPFPDWPWAEAVWTVESTGNRATRLCPRCLSALRTKGPRQSRRRPEKPNP